MLAGVRGGLWPLGHRHLEAASQTAIVGRHVGKSKGDAFARAQDDVGDLGVGLLDSPERVAGVFFFACNMDPSGTKDIQFTPVPSDGGQLQHNKFGSVTITSGKP